MSHFFSQKLGTLALVAGLGLTAIGQAAPPAKPKDDDKLDRLGKVAAVAAQKAEFDVRGAVLAAQQAKTPEKAIEILKKAVAKVEDNEVLPEARRASLKKMLEARIKVYEQAPDTKPLTEKDIEKTIRRYEDRVTDEKKKQEQKELQQGLKDLLDLQQAGKVEDARAKARQLAARFPTNPAVSAAVVTQSNMDQLATIRGIRKDKERGFDNAIRDIDRSSVIPKGDVEFPRDWKQRSEMRLKRYGPVKLSPKEQAIVRALSTPVSVNFKEDRFQDVIEYLATLLNQPILIDKNDLRDAQIDYETPVNLSVKNVTARTVLRKILGEYGLTYMVKDETLQVVSLAKARETMTIRAYPVGDMLGAGGGPGDPWTNIFGPGLGAAQRMQNAANLVNLIQSSVDPGSWQINGGNGTIAFDFATQSLVIKNSAEVHAMIGGGYLR